MDFIQCFLIDDDEDDREIFSLALNEVNPAIECIVACDAFEALEKLADEHFIPDIIFLDLNMPRLNGKKCLMEIKKIAHISNVPVIMYSTSLNNTDIAETKRLGAADFVSKPSSVFALTKILTHIFETQNLSLPSL